MGSGIVILLFIRAQFARVIGFVAIVLGLFSLVALSVPQMASLPPAEEKFDIATVKTPTDMAAIGQKIFFSKGQCALCHSIGPSESARCPDLKGIGAKLSREFIFESLTQPQAYVYLDYRHEGLPKEYPARMPYINKNPIGLTKNEILSVIAFLQQMSGEPISVSPSETRKCRDRLHPRRSRPEIRGRSPSHRHVEEAPMGALIKPIILMVVIYLFLKFIVPIIPGSAPLPSSLIFLYLMLTLSGIVIYCTLSGESKDAFWGPIQRFLTGENIGALQSARYGVLILFPLLVGWQTYGSTAVSDAPPAENRTIHPAPPGEYTGLSNPVAKPPRTSCRAKAFTRLSAPPATAEVSTARVRLPADSARRRPIFPTRRRSPCCRRAISSGASRRVE